MTWSELYEASRPHRLRGALFRVGVTGFIVVFIGTVAGVGSLYATDPVARYFPWVLVPLMLLVWGAFLLEGLRDVREPPVVLVGRVVHRGPTWGTDSGGPADVGVTRFVVTPRVSVEVREAWEVDAAGNARPRPDRLGRFDIDQVRWYRSLRQGDEVALVCLPRSTDPVMRVDPASLERAPWPST
jgi:hypothetical protein